MLLPLSFLLLTSRLLLGTHNSVSYPELFKENKEKLQNLVGSIEKDVFLEGSIYPDLISQKHAILLHRCWAATIYLPAYLMYQMARRAPLFSPVQERAAELIQLAKLTQELPIKQITLNMALGCIPQFELAHQAVKKYLRLLPSFAEKRHFLRDWVYNDKVPATVRILMRGISYVIFNSLDFYFLSPSFAGNGTMRLARSTYQNSITGILANLNYCRQLVRMIGDIRDHRKEIERLLAVALDIEGRFYGELFGDLWSKEQEELFAVNLRSLGLLVAQIMDGNILPVFDQLGLEYVTIS